MKSKLCFNAANKGQRPNVVSRWPLYAQPFYLAIVLLTFMQMGFVYTNPINTRANITTLSESLGGSSQNQPYNITTRYLRSRDKLTEQTVDILRAERSRSNEQVVQPSLGSSLIQRNHFQIPLNSERINSLPYTTSQNKESTEGEPTRGLIFNRPSQNVTNKFEAQPPMYSPADFISEGSGNGPLYQNSKQRPGKLDDTEEGDDDEDEDDYDDREMTDNNSDPDNDNFPRQHLNKKPASGVGSTNWPDSTNNPYVPFRGPGHTNSINRPVYQQINKTTQSIQHPSLRPQQNYSSFEHIDNPSEHHFMNEAKPPKPFLMTSAPQDGLEVPLSSNKEAPRYADPTGTIEYSSRANKTEIRPQPPIKFDQNATVSAKPKSPPNNLIITDSKIPLDSNGTLTTDSKSKDQDVDYDYEEEMDEEDAEDNSAFEDGEPLDVDRHDNKTAPNYPRLDKENPSEPPYNDSESYLKNSPNKINIIPTTAISSTTKIPANIAGVTMEPSHARVSTTTPYPTQYGSDTSDAQDYVDEEDEDPEDEEDDLNIEADDLDSEDDSLHEPDDMRNPAPTFPPIQIIPTTSTDTPVPVMANSSSKGPDMNEFETNRAQMTPPKDIFNMKEHPTESKKEPEVLKEVPSTTIPPFAIKTTTIPTKSYLPSSVQPSTTTTTAAATTTITSLLTLKPTPSPATTRTPLLTNLYTTPKSVDAIPSLGTNPTNVNYGSGSLDDEAGLTRQIYDKAVEMYQTVHKAVASAVDAVSQPNFDWSSSTFEPLLSQPLFFMLALGGAVIGLVLTMMLIVYIVSYQIQPKDDISLY